MTSQQNDPMTNDNDPMTAQQNDPMTNDIAAKWLNNSNANDSVAE